VQGIGRRANVSRIDRLIRRARQHLGPHELLLGSAVALEAEGRRQVVVLVTDDRVVVSGTGSQPPRAVELDGCAATYEHAGGRLTVERGEERIALRAVDATTGRQIIQQITHRQPRNEMISTPHVHRIRILS
jgi:hypothetical protein